MHKTFHAQCTLQAYFETRNSCFITVCICTSLFQNKKDWVYQHSKNRCHFITQCAWTCLIPSHFIAQRMHTRNYRPTWMQLPSMSLWTTNFAIVTPSTFLSPVGVSDDSHIRWLQQKLQERGVHWWTWQEDVVKHRIEHLKVTEQLRHLIRMSSSEVPCMCRNMYGEENRLVVLYHDESIYNTNKGQSWIWAEEDHPCWQKQREVG